MVFDDDFLDVSFQQTTNLVRLNLFDVRTCEYTA